MKRSLTAADGQNGSRLSHTCRKAFILILDCSFLSGKKPTSAVQMKNSSIPLSAVLHQPPSLSVGYTLLLLHFSILKKLSFYSCPLFQYQLFNSVGCQSPSTVPPHREATTLHPSLQVQRLLRYRTEMLRMRTRCDRTVFDVKHVTKY